MLDISRIVESFLKTVTYYHNYTMIIAKIAPFYGG